MHHYRPNRLDALKQGTTGFLIIAGLVIVFCTGILMITFAMGGVFRGTYTRDPLTNKITDAGTMNWVPLTFVFFTLGIAMILGAVGYGLYNVATERRGPRQSRAAKVLARYAFNRQGLMLVADWEIEAAENPRYYVRLDLGADLGTLECECSEQLFHQCGEGMTGTVELQGKWLGSFIPNVGANYRSDHIADIMTRGE